MVKTSFHPRRSDVRTTWRASGIHWANPGFVGLFLRGAMHDRISPGALKTLHRNKWTISATRGKRLNQLVVRPRESQIRSDLLEVLDDLRIQRNPRLPMFVHEREALLPVHIDPLLSMGLRAVLQLPREAVHVPPEFFDQAERRGSAGHEE